MANWLKQDACPKCQEDGRDRDGDNLSVYSDGSSYCHACTYSVTSKAVKSQFVKGEVRDLLKTRGISEEVCKFYEYKVGKYTGKVGNNEVVNTWMRIMEWKDRQGNVVMQKLKSANKDMVLKGSTSHKGLWGLDKFQLNENIFVTITEGEEDAMAIAQVQNCRFPVVSAGSATGALENIKADLDLLQKAKYVVLAFDNDEAGKKAVNKILSSQVFEPGKVRVATWTMKDANEMLLCGKQKEIIDCLFKAKVVEPDHVVTTGQILDKILQKPQRGLEMPWKTWDDWTYGLKFNEITTLVGPSGSGKTEMVKDLVNHLLQHTNVGVFSFEQSPDDTARRFIGAKLGVKLQKPGEVWDEEAIKKTAMEYNEKIFFYDLDGDVDIQDIFYSIRYLNKAKGVRWFVIDNLKSLRIVFKKEEVAKFTVKLKALVKELNIHVMLVCHVNRDSIRQSTHVGFSSQVEKPHENLTEDGIKEIMSKFALDWETGRMPTTSNIEGGTDIEAISDYVVSIGRNKRAEDDKVRRTIKVKLLKEGRIDSDCKTREFKLYREDNGTLVELTNDKENEIACNGFRNSGSLPF